MLTGFSTFRFSLPLTDLKPFVEAVKDIVKKTPTAFPLQGLYFRFSGKSDSYMSTSYGRNSVHVGFYRWQRNNPYDDATASLAGYQTILQTLVCNICCGKTTSYQRNDIGRVSVYHFTASYIQKSNFFSFQARRFKARSHWGKSGLVYHGREMLDLKLDVKARSNFVGTAYFNK